MDNGSQMTPQAQPTHKVVSDTKIALLALLMFVFGSLFSQAFTYGSFVNLKGSSIESQSSYTLEGVNKDIEESALIDGMKTIVLPAVTFEEIQSLVSQLRTSGNIKDSTVANSGQNTGGDLYYNCNYLDGTSVSNVWFASTEPMIVVVNGSGSVIGTCTTVSQ